MEYKVNANTTTTTSNDVNTFLNGVRTENNVDTNDPNVNYTVKLGESANKLLKTFSKMYYEILPDEERLNLLEYALTMTTGKAKNIFTTFKPLDIKISSKEEALRFFLFHIIILLAEKENKPPLAIIQTVCQRLLASEQKNRYILRPIQAFSRLSNIEQIFVRIDDYLLNLRDNVFDISLLTGLLAQLILLDMSAEYIK